MANESHFERTTDAATAAPKAGSLAPITHNTDLTDTAVKTKMRMGFLDKFKFDRENSEVMRVKLGEIAVTLMEKQKAEIVHSLMLDLDESKKRAFARYVEQVGQVNQDLIRASNQMELSLRRMLAEEIERAFVLKDDWKKLLNRLKTEGLATDAEYLQEVERMERWIDTMKGNIDGKVELVIRTHIKSLQVTLELLRDKAISGEQVL